ncbi:MAG: hypothetical protein KDD73_05400 [Anaerolineales bacterium]|nr:hypothetical protein [Anaerolineales bacterium]
MTEIPLIQIGVGGVGRALVAQLRAGRALHQARGLVFRHVVLADSSGVIVAGPRDFLADTLLDVVVRGKAEGRSLAQQRLATDGAALDTLLASAPWSWAVVVDTTAANASEMGPTLRGAVACGYGVVLANKKPLTSDLTLWEALTETGTLGYEATVGAGLPVIRTLQMLRDVGDPPHRIEGALSGTLGFLMSELQVGRSFADAVREAKQRGWTEPDPRDDLSGMDVARKALIMARTLGLRLSMGDIRVEPLYPPDMADLSLTTFMTALEALNDPMAAQVAEAQRGGKRLRYAAQIDVEAARINVGLRAVAADSALGSLRGADNLVAFHTAHYHDSPLVVQGAGAGTTRTACAVIADLLRCGTQSR